MDKNVYEGYIRILGKELIPALGCTEPIAIAYASAKAREVLGVFPEHIIVTCSGNIIKNVKGVVVPATGGLRGIEAAALIGAVGGDPSRELEVLTTVTERDRAAVKELVKQKICEVRISAHPAKLHIIVEMKAGLDTAIVEVVHSHTGIIRIEKNQEKLFWLPDHDTMDEEEDLDYSLLNMSSIYEFANQVAIADVREVLDRQIEYNTKIAEEGMKEDYGANVGKTLLENYGDRFRVMAKAMPAAGSDARMSGCELPVIINSGSGNQGMTVSLPVIACAKEVKASREQLYRALCISNLTAVYQKRDIGRLSAYCGAVSAGAGSGAGMMYLMGGSLQDISDVVTYTIANVGGIICDGAKSSCAAKIASAVDAALLAIDLTKKGRGFESGQGVVKSTVKETVAGVSTIAREGMEITDQVILDVMVNQ